MEAAGFEADYVHADIGWEFWIREGNPLPERTVELLAKHKLGLFGAITSKPKSLAAAELSPELRDRGLVYFSPIVTMRQRFNLDVCIRPCRTFPGNPLNYVRRGAAGIEDRQAPEPVQRKPAIERPRAQAPGAPAALLALIEHDVLPLIPSKGSVGASGAGAGAASGAAGAGSGPLPNGAHAAMIRPSRMPSSGRIHGPSPVARANSSSESTPQTSPNAASMNEPRF